MVNPGCFAPVLWDRNDSGHWHRGARADYNGGSLNSLNGANLVKSHERAVCCVLPHRPPRAKAHVYVNKQVRPRANSDREEIAVMAF